MASMGLAYASTGPSPRLRGTHLRSTFSFHLLRSIPAPAGNTFPRAHGTDRTPVHPRACGEHSGAKWAWRTCAGPSPRLRGTLPQKDKKRVVNRSIPAPAGNTPQWPGPAYPGPVHPRACGEHFTVNHADAFLPVHPRACGEHQSILSRYIALYGPSPRLRGTPRPPHRRGPGNGSIPAPAGNTGRTARTFRMSSVHPRACGEHGLPSSDTALPIGPSPRLRGTL